MANNKIQIKRSSVAGRVPTAEQLAVGEFAVNLTDNRLFTKDTTNTVIDVLGQSLNTTANVSFSQANIGNVVTTHVGSANSLLISSGTADSVVISPNGYNTQFLPSGQIRPSGTIMGSSYDSNQVDVTYLGPLQLKGMAYGVELTTSPDNGTISHVWTFGTDGNLGAPGNITANGTVAATTLTGNLAWSYITSKPDLKIDITGDATGNQTFTDLANGSINVTLANTTVTAGTYGNSSVIPVITVDSKGRITSATTNAVAGITGYSYTSANNTFAITAGDGSVYKATIGTVNTLSVSNTLTVTGVGTFSNDVNITGNLTVLGVTSFVNTTQLDIGDNIITLNANAAGTPVINAGIEIARGSSQNVALLWDETADKWTFTNDGTTFQQFIGNNQFDQTVLNIVSGYETAASNAYSNAVSFATSAASNAYSNAVSYADIVAGTAYSNAVSVAATDATNKAANAYSNAVSYADTVAGTAYSNAISTASTDATNKAANAYSNAISTAATDATNKAANAYSNAVSTASADATNKAANAYSNAVSYADTAAATAYSNAIAYAASNTYVNSTFAPLAGATFTGPVNGITTLAAGNTTITGYVNTDIGFYVYGTSSRVLTANASGIFPNSNTVGMNLGDVDKRWAYVGANTGNFSGSVGVGDALSVHGTLDVTNVATFSSLDGISARKVTSNTLSNVADLIMEPGQLAANGFVVLGYRNGSSNTNLKIDNAGIATFANTIIAPTIFVGNSTVNATVNSTAFALNGIPIGGSGDADIAYANAVSYANTAAATAYSNAVSTASTDATNKAANAYSNAVSAAATDATTKAGTAYSNAVFYADTAAGTAYANAIAYADVAANTAYTNARSWASYLYSTSASYTDIAANNAYNNAVSSATTLAATAYTNAASYADTVATTAYNNAVAYSGNAALAYANAVAYAASNTYVNDTFAPKSSPTFAGAITLGGITTFTGNIAFSGNTRIYANGYNEGTAGQVLTSGGAGSNLYWSTITGGGANLTLSAAASGIHYFPMSTTTTGAWANGEVDSALTYNPTSKIMSFAEGGLFVSQAGTGNTLIYGNKILLSVGSYDWANITAQQTAHYSSNSTAVVNASGIYIGNASFYATVNSTAFALNGVPVGGGSGATYTISTPANTSSANVKIVGSDASNSSVKIVGAGGIGISSDGTTITVDGSGITGGGGNAFGTIAVSGQSSLIADQTNTTLTFVAGNNVTLTTNTGSGSVTISATGGSGSSGNAAGNAFISGRDNFVGDGTETSFTLSQTGTANSILVLVEGLVQFHDEDYDVSGTALTFSAAPANNEAIEVLHISGASTYHFMQYGAIDTFTGDGSSTNYTLSVAANTSTATVYLDGLLQAPTTDFTISGTTLSFTSAPLQDEVVLVYHTESISSAIPGISISGTDTFAGNGSNTNFTVSSTADASSSLVTVNGIVQRYGVDYSITGLTLSFVDAPPDDSAIQAMRFSGSVGTAYRSVTVGPSTIAAESADSTLTIANTSGVTVSASNNTVTIGLTNIDKQSLTGNGSNTVFTLTHSATADDLFVYVNGVYFHPEEDYDVSGDTLTFTTAPEDTSQIRIRFMRAPTGLLSLMGDLELGTGVYDMNTQDGPPVDLNA